MSPTINITAGQLTAICVVIVACAVVAFKFFDWSLKMWPSKRNGGNSGGADKGLTVVIENNTQAIRDVGQLVQATQVSLQSSITGQAAMMEILKSIKAHCDQENNWWMEIMRVRGG